MRTIIVIGLILTAVLFGIKTLNGVKEKVGNHNSQIQKVMKEY